MQQVTVVVRETVVVTVPDGPVEEVVARALSHVRRSHPFASFEVAKVDDRWTGVEGLRVHPSYYEP